MAGTISCNNDGYRLFKYSSDTTGNEYMKNLSTVSDEEIVLVVRSGQKEAYAEIIKRYQAKLLRYANYIMREEQMAADVVQDGFIKAYVNLHGFDTKRSFSSWIYRIVHNAAMNALPKHRQHLQLDERFQFDSGVDLENETIKQELVLQAHDCLEQMPILYSEPITLYFLEDKTYEEISDILRIPIGTVGTRINRGKAVMRKLCQKKH